MKHLLIPDCQISPNVDLYHLEATGNFIVDKKPDTIICIGDFAEMHSLSSYDMGRKAGEGARYEEDIEWSRRAMEVLLAPIKRYNQEQYRKKAKQYKPRKILTIGNHEERINRHVNTYPLLEGKLSISDLGYESYGWEVSRFLEVVEVDGILYSHYFPRNASGRITQNRSGAPTAYHQVRREMQSCSSGHLQGLDFSVQQTGSRRFYGLIAGSFYLHDPEYLTPQGTAYWRGVVLKNEVNDGEYDPCFISINYLMKKYL